MSQETLENFEEENAVRNDFLPFANTATANVLDQAAYQALEARTNGFVSGVAKSAHLNKVWRQSSIMSASLAQYIVNRTGQEVIDDGDIQKLAALIEMAVKKTSGLGVPMGGIIAWSGAKAAIPAGFSLCDGANGTPNLIDRFILGGADKGAAGGSAKIAIANLPSHDHGGATGNASADHTHHIDTNAGISGSTGGAGGHSHGVSDGGHAHNIMGNNGSDKSGEWSITADRHNNWNKGTEGSGSNIGIQGVGDHAHSFSGNAHLAADTGGMSANHNHAIGAEGGGADYLPPYFQLCYIMRTSEE